MVSAPNDSAPATAGRTKLLELTQKRLERFVTFSAKFLVKDDPETIHDLRVWSRRLQQALRTVLRQAKTPARRKVVRTLRRVRQALGSCRNLDVNIDLARQRSQSAESPNSRAGWEAVKMYLEQSRASELAGAHEQLAKHDLVAFSARARKLIAHADPEPLERLEAAVGRSLAQWDEAYGLAHESPSIAHLHAWRIATKRLRYRLELLADSGSATSKPLIRDLKEIQTTLGDWHDRCVLLECVAAFLARPDFLAQHPDMGGALLADMEKERERNDAAIETVLSRAAGMRSRWTSRQFCRRPQAEKAKDQ
jgi:CHAD domain-containing protein